MTMIPRSLPQIDMRSDDIGPELVHVPWGYILTAESEVGGVSLVGRAIGRFIAVIVGLVLAGIWLYPGVASYTDPIMFAMKFGLSFVFIGIGGLLYLFGQDARRASTQVDLVSREIRSGTVDGRGKFHLGSVAAFDEISSILIARTPGEAMPASLFGRIGDQMAAIEIVGGSEELLAPIRERLVRDLRDDRGAVARNTMSRIMHRNASVTAPVRGRGEIAATVAV